ncbi:MAG: 5-formyltetrahydrofolate cyclo-ligase [Pseudomonadota bacterium]
MSLAEAKAAARQAAFARRKAAKAMAGGTPHALLSSFLAGEDAAVVAGYMPINTEIDPRPAMAERIGLSSVCIPVIEGAGLPLRFAAWTPDTKLIPGPFKALIPEEPSYLTPDLLIVPLVAFTRDGHRLGYGGGFYDRTLDALRGCAPTLAVGFAYAAQEAETLPMEATDAPLDAIVTEREIIDLRR